MKCLCQVHVRSSDGRGPLWWAYEYGHREIVDLLVSAGADESARDATGMLPNELYTAGAGYAASS